VSEKLARKIGKANKDHGQALSPEYRAWMGIRQRCNNPKFHGYHRYGGRGIKVCQHWDNPDGFMAFFSDMGARPSPQHSIDRIDVNGHYYPENCRWATKKEQGRNRRDNTLLTFRGETRTMIEWCDVLGIDSGTLCSRLYGSKWPVDKALGTPVRHYKKRSP
jgi:hypothetical protein